MRSLADLLADLEQDQHLPATRRRDLKSAIRRFCGLIGRDPARVPASVAEIKGAVNALTPGGAGVSAKTLQNLRTYLLAALRHGNARTPRSIAMTSEWQALHDRLPDKRMTSGLSRFLRYCSAGGVAPEAVDDAVVGAFMEWVRSATFVAKPNEVHRQTCRLWNEAIDKVEDWPQQRLTLPDHRAPRTSIPLGDFPAAFTRDVERHLDWLTAPDPFDDERPRKAAKPRTVNQRRNLITLAASAWVHRGHDRERLQSLADLVAVEAAKEIFRHYLGQNRPRAPAFLHGLAQMLFSVAREWVRVEPGHLEGLRNVRRRLPAVPPGMTGKNRALLRQFEDPGTLHRLLDLPGNLLADIRRGRTTGEQAAVQAQLAVAVELLLMAPIRMANLTALRLGHEVVRPGNRGTGYRLVIDAADTKNAEPLEFALPAELSEMIDLYLHDFQPQLAAPENPHLFPARGGRGPKANQPLPSNCRNGSSGAWASR